VQTIQQVLAELDDITESCYRQQDVLGIFAAVYRRTTEAVREAIQKGMFDDDSRMEQLDVAFALRYIRAYHSYRREEPTSRSWEVAFEAARQNKLVLMQHLLLGMNAHILLDLGVAAAEVCPGESIYSLEKDFMTINDVLANLIDEIQMDIGRYSPVWKFLDKAGWRLDERMVAKGIRHARNKAWEDAQALAFLSGQAFEQRVSFIDAEVASGANRIIKVVRVARPLLWLIRRTEKNVLKAIPELQYK